jgi:serine/threonine protein kinase
MGDPDSLCSRCGAPLPARAAEGFCPQCLLRLGLEGDADGEEDSADSPPTEAAPTPQAAPERIGPYRILQVLGEGGMGIVYLAEQVEPIRRRVALKVVKPGMDTREVLARFEAERQALAVMSHANVARVFDAGATEQGRPYFVMEYVPGIRITEYCDMRCLSVRERLELFTEVCNAIQHAHQKGVIHRDIKPSNVLVSSEEGKPVPKVIDFGLAKAMGQQLTARTLFTQHGVLIGTPEYMSPEQAGSTALEVDARTDIYSLGVLLYELLVGALPFDPATLRRAAAVEMMRIIREEDPPKPTTKFDSLGDNASEVARHRHTDVRSLARQIHDELDWITMRAMDKDPARRYSSASELAEDVRRHLTDEPVLARPPSVAYRLRKRLRKHRAAVAAVGAVGAVLMIALTTAVVVHLRTEAARDEALRWTLKQVVARGVDPKAVQPRWTELEGRMHQEVRSAPNGDLAWLAREAAARLRIVAPKFGLLSDLPELEVSFNVPIDPGMSYLYIAEIEGSWDGGPWKRITSGFTHRIGRPDAGWSMNQDAVRLDRFLGPDQLAAAPHRLDLRVHYTWLEPDIASPFPDVESSKAYFLKGPIDSEWPEARRSPALHTRTCSLEPLSINLFDAYPENFPVRVFENEDTGPLASWFRMERVRLLRVRLPQGPPLKSIWFSRAGFIINVDLAPGQVSSTSPPFVGFEMEGTMVEQTPLPLAAQVTLRVAGSQDPVVSFPFALGPGVTQLNGWRIASGRSDGALSLITAVREDPPIVAPHTTADRTLEGLLEFEPSRAIAVETRTLDRYIGSKLTIPVKVEILTLDGYLSADAAARALDAHHQTQS